MQMVPAVVGDREAAGIDGGRPPVVVQRAFVEVVGAGTGRRFHAPARFGRRDDEARATGAGLAAGRGELFQDVEEAPLQPESGVPVIDSVVLRPVVEGERDDAGLRGTCMFPPNGSARRVALHRQEQLQKFRQRYDAIAGGVDHAKIDGERDVVVRRVVGAGDVMRVVREDEHGSIRGSGAGEV